MFVWCCYLRAASSVEDLANKKSPVRRATLFQDTMLFRDIKWSFASVNLLEFIRLWKDVD